MALGGRGDAVGHGTATWEGRGSVRLTVWFAVLGPVAQEKTGYIYKHTHAHTHTKRFH